MDELVRRFRRAAGERSGLRYGSELRHLAVQYAEVAEARGESLREIATVLGLNALTLARWRSGARRQVAASALHEVVVVDAAGRPVLVMPSGVRVEGLSLRELITVLEGLG